ncbi:MOXD1 homolog 1-like [Paramacrobiotus metropolitanus]|uniref:MOXD1 homolog 1-like n=1 Tax=Paramacrobiotus metropolitanus TaxID=2943436 RepID=UPI002445CF38|nr:MOXD1 homolog 1-like [Paramacrobiotus metropolitanus]
MDVYFFVIVLCLAAFARGIQLNQVKRLPAAQYGQSAGKGIEITWGTNQSHIEVQLAYPTLGWLAMGLSPNGGMDQSDVLFGYVDDRTHQPVVQDRWLTANLAQGRVLLTLDTKQDWMAVSGSKNTTHTLLRAVRKLKTCDAQDRSITDADMPVIYSYSFRQPLGPNAVVTKHDVRGSVTVDFFPKDSDETPPPEPVRKTLEFRANNVKVTKGKQNQYYCTLKRIPDLDKKYHAIGYEVYLNPKNLPYLHHMDAYLCNGLTADQKRRETFPCGPEEGSLIMSVCNDFLAGWQSLTKTSYYPPEVGVPFTPQMSGRYVVIQVHYDNTDNIEFNDDSGIKFLLTDSLRKYDSGLLTVGAMDEDLSFAIPPRQPVFQMQAQCSDACTRKYFPKDGIRIYSSTLHMHTRGVGAVLRHFRGQREFPPIDVDGSYDYNRQGERPVTPPRQVLPGDRLVMQCNYTTLKDAAPVFGGEGLNEEMCMVFLNYYPKSGLYDCGASYPLARLLQRGLQIDKPTLTTLGKTIPNEMFNRFLKGDLEDDELEMVTRQLTTPVTNYIKQTTWTPQKVSAWEAFYFDRASYDAVCIGENGQDFMDDHPPVIRPYVVQKTEAGC